MPDLKIKTPTGTIVFNYVISTPSKASASSINPALPTILFLHPVYLGKIIYHQQFADRHLRRFNLVGLDLRLHGQTQGKLGKGYGREVAAQDVGLFMAKLKIQKYHLFGMSMGGCIGLQTAMLFPSCVLSVFVVSSLPLTEPPDVGEGRLEIYEYWEEGVRSGGSFEGSAMSDAIVGSLQLSVNNLPVPIVDAMLRASKDCMMAQWSTDRLADFRTASVDFFTLRKAYTTTAMRAIACPVYLLHCGADVAYTLADTQQVADHLRTAGVAVKVGQVADAPHFGALTHPKEVNKIYHQFILGLCAGAPPPVPPHAESPFADRLAAVGWDSDDGSDSEEFFI
ncbi:Alpha/Beta hydrolase protein [Mycena belliarum]|uniref:Alpha/Beta hydrolase protein n=1 Tax=Mycena belliarum TaxID=1033014 RepID=A0AAD6U1C0_9AGAR|nr:Alpha/Beta hydrolase protein [Mycena belliae]